MFGRRQGKIDRCHDLDRIEALNGADTFDLCDDQSAPCGVCLGCSLTELLTHRAAPGTRLRDPQCRALLTLLSMGGLFAPMRCGSGKTLVTLLAATVLAHVKRPLLVVPAALRERTRADARAYIEQGWLIRLPRIISYEELSRVTQKDFLSIYQPDLLILDEAHKVANWNTAVTRRIDRYVIDTRKANRYSLVVVALSGTLIGIDLLKYQHIARWCLGTASPAPIVRATAEKWQGTLHPSRMGQAYDPGEIAHWLDGAYERHARSRDGVVATVETECDAALEIHRWRPPLPDHLQDMIDTVTVTQKRPDGVDLFDEFAGLASTISQLSLGFYYVWDPPAPQKWLDVRSEWASFVRETLEECRDDEERDPIDSELQVRLAYPQEAAPWLAIRDTFRPNPVPVWESDAVLEQIEEWAEQYGGVVWVRYRAVAERLRLPFYDSPASIEQARDRALSASIGSCGTGSNLQHYSRGLVTTPMSSAVLWEQLLSRTHRSGQTADVIEWYVIATVEQHRKAFAQAREQARKITLSGDPQRLSLATYV